MANLSDECTPEKAAGYVSEMGLLGLRVARLLLKLTLGQEEKGYLITFCERRYRIYTTFRPLQLVITPLDH